MPQLHPKVLIPGHNINSSRHKLSPSPQINEQVHTKFTPSTEWAKCPRCSCACCSACCTRWSYRGCRYAPSGQGQRSAGQQSRWGRPYGGGRSTVNLDQAPSTHESSGREPKIHTTYSSRDWRRTGSWPPATATSKFSPANQFSFFRSVQKLRANLYM